MKKIFEVGPFTSCREVITKLVTRRTEQSTFIIFIKIELCIIDEDKKIIQPTQTGRGDVIKLTTKENLVSMR